MIVKGDGGSKPLETPETLNLVKGTAEIRAVTKIIIGDPKCGAKIRKNGNHAKIGQTA